MTEKEKEYVFDSLVFRFKDYQNRCFDYELAMYEYRHPEKSKRQAIAKVKSMHERDLMRFVEILRDCFDEIKVGE